MAESAEMHGLIQQAGAGDQLAANELFVRFHDRLLRMIRLRMDHRLKGRVDSEDIVQEAYLDAAKRRKDFAARPSMSFFLWLRSLTAQKLIDAQRRSCPVFQDSRNDSDKRSIARGRCP
jgi:RNA polymerase sigma-70 factor, ECF subfamily